MISNKEIGKSLAYLKTYPLYSFLIPLILFMGFQIKAQKPDSIINTNPQKSLGYYLELGLKNSPLLQDNQNLQNRFTLDSSRIAATQKPQVSLNSTAQFYPSINGYGYNQSISNGGNYLATVGFTLPIFNTYSLKTLKNGNRIKQDSILNRKKINLLELKRNITNQYILAYADTRQIRFQKEIAKLYLEQEGATKKLVQTGIYKQSDYLTFLVSKEAQAIAITQSEISLHNNLSQLNLLCGIVDTITYTLDNPSMTLGILKPLENTESYQQFLLDSLSLVGQKAAIASAYHPKVNWFGDAGFVAPNFDQFYKSFGASIGLSLSFPLYDGHQKQIAQKQIDLDEKTRKAYLNWFVRQYFQQILNLRKQLYDTEQLENLLKGQLKNNMNLVAVDRKLLNVGDLKINDLILAINNYKNIQYSITQTEINRLSILNQINFWSTQY